MAEIRGKTSSSTLEESLRKHGEAFMRMFDGSDEDRGEGPDVDADAEARVDVPAPAGPVETEDSPAPAGKKSRKKNKKNKKNKKRHDEDSDTAYQSLPSKDARNGDDLDAIFGAIDRPGADIGADSDEEKPRHPTSEGKRRRKSWTTPSQGIDNALEAQMREEERLRRKIERKRFMSSNPDSMLSFDEKAMLLEAKRRAEKSQASGWVDKKTEMEEFKAIRREIQSFGATGLDKKSRAKFEQDRLLELGARKEKGVRMPAKIGMGIAKKAAWREQRSIDEAIASGMVSRKAIAEKKRRALKKERSSQDRGLWEDGGKFNPRSGVLRVKKK